MFCNKCGASISDEYKVCPHCGNVVAGNQYNATYTNQPNYQQGQYYQPPQYNQQQYPPFNQEQSNINDEISTAKTLGIIAIVCGLCLPSIGWIVALVCGIIGLTKVNHALSSPYGASNPDARTAKKMNIAGIVIPIVEVVLVIIAWILIAFLGIAMVDSYGPLVDFNYF